MTMILLNSLYFSIPGMIFGLLVAFIINIGIREILFLDASNGLDYDLTKPALITGICFGFVMPILSNYYPV